MPVTLEITHLKYTVQDYPRLLELTIPGPSVFKNWLAESVPDLNPVLVVLARSRESILGWMGVDRFGVIGWFVDPQFRHVGIATKMTTLISELGLMPNYINAQPQDPAVERLLAKVGYRMIYSGSRYLLEFAMYTNRPVTESDN